MSGIMEEVGGVRVRVRWGELLLLLLLFFLGEGGVFFDDLLTLGARANLGYPIAARRGHL